MLHVFLYVTVRIGQNLLNEVPVESSILADFPNYYFKASNGNFNESRNFFMPRVTNNNLRGRGLNVSQPSYNNRFMHNFFLILLPMCGIICLSLLNLLPPSSNLGY